VTSGKRPFAVVLASLLSGCLGPVPPREAKVDPLPTRTVSLPSPVVLSPDGAAFAPVAAEDLPDFSDDGGLMDLKESVRQSLEYYRSLHPETVFVLGPERVTAVRMAAGLESFLELMDLPPAEFRAEVPRLFTAYAPPGPRPTLSAYYEHALDAALAPGGIYQFPIYGKPTDLKEVDSPRGKTVGRYEGEALVPYYSRKEIDSDGALEGKGLEIAWAADPLDIFFLQVQGSGWLRVAGEPAPLRVRFAAHNGLPYKSVGAEMIKRGLMSSGGSAREKLVRYMREHPEERQELLNHNPRYVFFRLDHGPEAGSAVGALQRPLTPRRSVAADKALFPPGALAWMESDKFGARRFVLVQDEGGAIKGPGRIDYFVGAGKEAEDYAVKFWTQGKFLVLVPKEMSAEH
jgi:membrane-bound lytic murein transglycosylase A